MHQKLERHARFNKEVQRRADENEKNKKCEIVDVAKYKVEASIKNKLASNRVKHGQV